jgi:membrane-associated phospholipid phosphatase
LQKIGARDAGRVRRLALIALLAMAALLVLYVLAVRTGWGQELDDAALEGRTTRHRVQVATDHLLNTISVSSLVLLGGGIVTIAVARRRVHLAFVAGVVVAGACTTTEVLKHFILGRPDLVNPNPLGPSFPSGHTTVAMSLVVALVLVVPPHRRALVALVGLAYACLIGGGVVTAGWHRPSDVMGAFFVVTAWATAGTAALIAWRGAPPDGEPPDSTDDVVDPLAIGGAALLAVGFVGFVIVYLAIRQDRLDAVRLSGAYAAALIAIVGTGLIAMATILAAIRGLELDPVSRGGALRGTGRQAP